MFRNETARVPPLHYYRQLLEQVRKSCLSFSTSVTLVISLPISLTSNGFLVPDSRRFDDHWVNTNGCTCWSACSAAAPASLAELKASGTVTSHARGLLMVYGRMVVPSGRFSKFHGSPNNVEITVALLSRSTFATIQAVKTSSIDWFATSTIVWSVGHCDSDVLTRQAKANWRDWRCRQAVVWMCWGCRQRSCLVNVIASLRSD